jgi:hypothetical protein
MPIIGMLFIMGMPFIGIPFIGIEFIIGIPMFELVVGIAFIIMMTASYARPRSRQVFDPDRDPLPGRFLCSDGGVSRSSEILSAGADSLLAGAEKLSRDQ